MKRQPIHPGLGLWFVLCVLALGVFLLNPSNSEAALFCGIAMLLLTFPSGFAVAVPLGLAASVLEGTAVPRLLDSLGPVPTVLFWCAMVAVGYMQWRYWVPWLIQKLQTHTPT